jgi:hypothetical protein
MIVPGRFRAILAALLLVLAVVPAQAFAEAKLVYSDGQAIADARGQVLALTLDGAQVTGKFRTEPVCDGTSMLAGGEGTFRAVLTGVWESPEAVIAGTWQGFSQGCGGSPTPQTGTIAIVLGPRPGGGVAVVATISASASPGGPALGSYSYLFTPRGQQVADGGGGAGLAPVEVSYADGQAIQDARSQTMKLTFRGARVTGTISTNAVCDGTAFLAGGEASIEAVLQGPWEGRASVIEGSWGGVNNRCGGDVAADRGAVRIVMSRRTDGSLGVLVTLTGTEAPGSYSYEYSPRGQIFVPGLFEAPGAGVELVYPAGEAWADPRSQSADLSFAEDRVWGTVHTPAVCDAGAGIFLGGGEVTVEAELRGPWEGQGSMIFGAWGGTDEPCGGAALPNRGDVCMFVGPDQRDQTAVLLRLFGEDGAGQDYVHQLLRRDAAVGLPPAAAGMAPVTIKYPDGRAWADPRTQQMALAIQGNRAFGTMHVDAVCDATTFLNGGSVQFEGTLTGDWEAPDTLITGFWGGQTEPCGGAPRQDFGTFAMRLGPTPGGDPGVIVELTDLRGDTYAYFHPPAGALAASFGGAPFVADPFYARAIAGCRMPAPDIVEQYVAAAASGTPFTPPRDDRHVASSIVLLLDASGSMADEGRMDQAKASARRILGQMTGDTEVALIVFYDCGSISVAAPFTTDPAVISAALEPVQPSGGTPLAAGIDFAQAYLESEASGAPRLVVLTDGEESCSGDLMQAVSE